MFEKYKISDMIKALEKKQEEHGDIDILLASDPSGDNLSFVGDLVQRHQDQKPIVEQDPFKAYGDKLIIFPANPIPIQSFFKDMKL